MIWQGTTNLAETTNTLAKTSIELAQAASDYGALKVIFGLFLVIVIMLILIIIWVMVTTIKRIGKIEKASDKTLAYFDNLSNKTIGKEEGNAILRETLNRSSILIQYYILRIRWENHIDDKEKVHTKVSQIVENNFAEINQLLSRFLCVGKPLSSLIDYDDAKVLKQLMIDQIYIPKEDFTPSNMDQSVELFYSGLKLEYIKKLEE